jgi:hypothetical protein
MRRSAAYLPILRDRRDAQHLWVSPLAVTGINETSKVMYGFVILEVLRAIPTRLPNLLRRGCDAVLAEEIARRLGIDIYTRQFPLERSLVLGMVEVLAGEHGWMPERWALALRKEPEKVLTTLARTGFGAVWVKQAEADKRLRSVVEAQPTKRRGALIGLLLDPRLDTKDAIVSVTLEAVRARLDRAASATA